MDRGSVNNLTEASPHTRGWTPTYRGDGLSAHGFPAHAGMDPWAAPPSVDRRRLPRTRGDGPFRVRPRATVSRASPHTRGWTPRLLGRGLRECGFPAHAGMDPDVTDIPEIHRRLPRTRGDGPIEFLPQRAFDRASPHTRGWTRTHRRGQESEVGFPAHAGMDLQGAVATTQLQGLPRTRGDGPL